MIFKDFQELRQELYDTRIGYLHKLAYLSIEDINHHEIGFIQGCVYAIDEIYEMICYTINNKDEL
jgi:hypothetical protein